LQPLCGGCSLQHGTFRDLLKSFFGFPIFRLGGKAEVSITPPFCSGHESFILLLRKVSNYDIQIGVRHFSFPHAPISAFHMIKYAIAEEALQIRGWRMHQL
jgi:hypothetical protein